jgi:hypothetical protein
VGAVVPPALKGCLCHELHRPFGLDAAIHADLRRADGTGWAVMTDPEGNEFCVELTRSADRFAAGRPGGGPSMTE